MELRLMAQANLDMVILQENKLMYGLYTRRLSGYRVFATDVLIQNCDRVTVLYRSPPMFSVEDI